MRGVVGICAALVAGLGASQAGATVIFSDNFDSESVPAGSWIMNDTSFNNFNVTAGSVDLLTTGNPFGLVGSGTNTTGNFVDLDGSTLAGGTLTTKQTFNFTAGQTVTLSLDVGGNQRSGTDNLFAGFDFGAAPMISNLTTTGFTGNMVMGNQVLGTDQLASTAGFQTLTVSFTALANGSFAALVGTDSADNIGPLVDNVLLTETGFATVPEPMSWALMITGFAGMGAMLRRRARPATA